MHTHRSSYMQTLQVLEAIHRGEKPEEIKARLQLSRYSYEYTINRLLANHLVEPTPGGLALTVKALNILRYNDGVRPLKKPAR